MWQQLSWTGETPLWSARIFQCWNVFCIENEMKSYCYWELKLEEITLNQAVMLAYTSLSWALLAAPRYLYETSGFQSPWHLRYKATSKIRWIPTNLSHLEKGAGSLKLIRFCILHFEFLTGTVDVKIYHRVIDGHDNYRYSKITLPMETIQSFRSVSLGYVDIVCK